MPRRNGNGDCGTAPRQRRGDELLYSNPAQSMEAHHEDARKLPQPNVSVIFGPAAAEYFRDSPVRLVDLPLTPRRCHWEHNRLDLSGDCKPLQCLPTGVGSAANLNRLQPASACATLEPKAHGAATNPPAIRA